MQSGVSAPHLVLLPVSEHSHVHVLCGNQQAAQRPVVGRKALEKAWQRLHEGGGKSLHQVNLALLRGRGHGRTAGEAGG